MQKVSGSVSPGKPPSDPGEQLPVRVDNTKLDASMVLVSIKQLPVYYSSFQFAKPEQEVALAVPLGNVQAQTLMSLWEKRDSLCKLFCNVFRICIE